AAVVRPESASVDRGRGGGMVEDAVACKGAGPAEASPSSGAGETPRATAASAKAAGPAEVAAEAARHAGVTQPGRALCERIVGRDGVGQRHQDHEGGEQPRSPGDEP